MNVIIVGCTRVGISLATDLCRAGHEVAVIDSDTKSFSNLPAFFNGLTVEGIGMDTSVLEKAGIMNCDALATVTDNDNQNIVVSQIAKSKYEISNIVARISDPVRESVYQKMGLKTVCPTNIEGTTIFNLITGENFDSLVDFGNRTARFVTRFDKKWVGMPICDVPTFNGEIVYAIIDKNGELSLAFDRKRIVEENEKIVFSALAD